MIKYVKYGFLLIASCCLAGCLQPIAIPALSTYSLGNVSPVKITQAKTRLILLVTQPVANSGFASASMVYLNVPFDLKTFANNQWVAPPGHMLLPLMTQAIVARHYFHTVVSAPYSGLANYRLDTRLVALQQEFLRPTSQVRLIMQAYLLSNQSNRVVASQRFQAVVAAPGNNPYSGVLAAHQATKIICRKIAQFVVVSTQSAEKISTKQ